jgi:hypothetical protein
MRRLFLAILFLRALTLHAQETIYQPQFWVGAGLAYNYYAAPSAAAGWISLAVRIADRTYSFSTMDMTRVQASLRTGVSRILTQSGNFTVVALGDAGLTTINGVALGSFSGGGMLLYDLGGVSPKLKHSYVTTVMRVIAVNSTSVQPVFEFGISKGF